MPRLAQSLLVTLSCAALTLSGAARSQGNDDDYTPLNSRIKRDRQFPLEPRRTFQIKELSEANRKRSRAMMSQFSKCLYRRSNERSLDLLARTDYGFVAFEQVDMEVEQFKRVLGFQDCLRRVAETNNSGVVLQFYAGGVRQWLLQEAYFARYPDSPTWMTPGAVVAERTYPLSANNPGVHAAMDFADCMVASDPFGTDYLFRTTNGSEEEGRALQSLSPLLAPCLPRGSQLQIDPGVFRVWIGEALWHAANHSGPAGDGPGLSPLSGPITPEGAE